MYSVLVYLHNYSQNGCNTYIGTVNTTSDYVLWTLYRPYFKGNSTIIELQVYNVLITVQFPLSKTMYWDGSAPLNHLSDLLSFYNVDHDFYKFPHMR
jgi:hypothetical protein